MNNDMDFFEYYFIETEDEIYYISEIPNMVYDKSFGGYLFNHEEILLINRADKENDEYVMAYRMPTDKIISWGTGQTIESFLQDELEDIRKNGTFNGKTLYTLV